MNLIETLENQAKQLQREIESKKIALEKVKEAIFSLKEIVIKERRSLGLPDNLLESPTVNKKHVSLHVKQQKISKKDLKLTESYEKWKESEKAISEFMKPTPAVRHLFLHLLEKDVKLSLVEIADFLRTLKYRNKLNSKTLDMSASAHAATKHLVHSGFLEESIEYSDILKRTSKFYKIKNNN